MLLCRAGQVLIAVSAADGRELWRYDQGRSLATIGQAGGRVTVSVDNDLLAVLDLKTGRLLQRIALDGAVPEATPMTTYGPVTLIIPQAPTDLGGRKIVLPPAEGPGGEAGSRIVVSISDVDPERRLVAIAVGPDGDDGGQTVQPFKSLWSVSFPGYSYTLTVVDGVVVGQPLEGTYMGFDAASGERVFSLQVGADDLVAFDDDGGILARQEGGAWGYGAIDVWTGQRRWWRTWEHLIPPMAVASGDGEVMVATPYRWQVHRAADGAPMVHGEILEGDTLLNAHAFRGAVLAAISHRFSSDSQET